MLLPVQDAAAALGISISGVRRGLKSGRLVGQRKATPQGHVWLVEVPDDQVVNGRSPGSRVVGDRPATRVVDPPLQEAPGAALAAQRARDMAELLERVQAPLLARLEAQAQEIGALRERLTAAEKSAAPEAGRRRWWRWLWG